MSKPLCVDLFCGLGGWTDGFLAEGWNVVGFDITRHVYGADRYPAQLVLQDVLTIHGSQLRNADIIVASPPCQSYSWLAMPWSRSKPDKCDCTLRVSLDQDGQYAGECRVDPDPACVECKGAGEVHRNSKAAKALRAKWEAEGPDNRLFDACFRIQREAIYAKRLALKCCPLDYSMPGCKRCHIPLVVENVRGAQEWVGRSAWNYGSFHLWGDVPALMPKAWKVPPKRAMDDLKYGQRKLLHQHLPVGTGPLGRNAEGEGVKTVAHVNKRDGHSHTRHLTNQAEHDAVKIGGDWFSNSQSPIRKASHKSSARKAASAKIAKIPLPLSTHIARVYKP